MTGLRDAVAAWEQWALTADRSESGWQTDAPSWPALLALAETAMLDPAVDDATIALLAFAWAASHEGETMADFAIEHIDRCWGVLERLAHSPLPDCRWQVYVAAAAAGARADALLRRGLEDPDPYARRRAAASLATLSRR